MSRNSFFKPTTIYKEFMILDLIEKDANITQRRISELVDISVSMVNYYVDDYEKAGYITRKYQSTKTVKYLITKIGIERRKLLNIWYLQSAHSVYMSAKNNITMFLNQIIEKGFKDILLYGAGEVAEIILQSMNDDMTIPLHVKAVIDDDLTKKGQVVVNLPIIDTHQIHDYKHDGILVASYKHHNAINKHLKDLDYPQHKIINFFDN